MSRNLWFPFALILLMAASVPAARAAIALGQIDDFQDGTTNNWTNNAATFSNQDGGPAGTGDLYMQIISTGTAGPGSKLAVFNTMQWTGDYAAAGVTAVQLDMANFGKTDLDMRLFLFGATAQFTNTVAASVPADGVWRTYTLGVSEADMTQVGGVGTFGDTISDVQRLLLRHDDDPPSGVGDGTVVVGTLGVDNIEALGSCGGLICADANCSGAVDAEDIDPFFVALGSAAVYEAMYPDCDLVCNCDVNGSGGVDSEDIDPFFVALSLGACP